nr:MFS transporter [Lysinibacillus timonensis]
MDSRAWKALVWIGLSELLALSLWFSASVISPQLIHQWNLDKSLEGWLSSAVPLGFVIGALVSSLFGMADRFNPRGIFALAALCGALLNSLLIFTDHAFWGILLRILTGISLAGVYPIAVKMISLWFPKRRGLAMGILVAALTLGSALPHFVKVFFVSVNWQSVIIVTSLLAILASIIIYYIVEDAPQEEKNTPFSFKLIRKVVKNKAAMLINYGYFGHNWELYGMWTWLPTFLVASFETSLPHVSEWYIALSSFSVIGIAGGIGCIVGGLLSDKIGRANLTILSMVVSSLCCILIGFTFGYSIWLTLTIAFIWGASIISDSAQFSAAVSEETDREYVGTALTFQMCIGFLITIFSINLVPIVQTLIGWEWVFLILAIGPILGTFAMIQYKRSQVN